MERKKKTVEKREVGKKVIERRGVEKMVVGKKGVEKNQKKTLPKNTMVSPHPESPPDHLIISSNTGLVYAHIRNRNNLSTCETWVKAGSINANG